MSLHNYSILWKKYDVIKVKSKVSDDYCANSTLTTVLSP
jgi:hypothetical protein